MRDCFSSLCLERCAASKPIRSLPRASSEEVATFDSAAAWAMMLNSNQFFTCRLPVEGIEEIYGNGDAANFAAAASGTCEGRK